MRPEDLTPDCDRFRSDLAAHLYLELSSEARAALEHHLKACAACRDELAALGETHKLLDLWETPALEEDPRRLARAIAARAEHARRPRARLVRLVALLSGAAAALLFALCLLNTEAELQNGHLRLSFALPGARTSTASAPDEPDWDERIRAIAAQEVSMQAANLQQSQEELFQRCSQMTQEELLRLAQAVDLALAENERGVSTRLATLKREADVNDLAQRQAITDLATYIRPSSYTNR